MDDTTITVRGVDMETWKEFQKRIIDIEGNIYGNLGKKVTEALKLWLDKNSIAPKSIIAKPKTTSKEVRITLSEPREPGANPSWRTYNLIDIPKRFREFFPGYKESFILETDVGEIRTHVVGARRNTPIGAMEGSFFTKGLGKWYNRHPELKPGDQILIREIEPKKRYRLKVL